MYTNSVRSSTFVADLSLVRSTILRKKSTRNLHLFVRISPHALYSQELKRTIHALSLSHARMGPAAQRLPDIVIMVRSIAAQPVKVPTMFAGQTAMPKRSVAKTLRYLVRNVRSMFVVQNLGMIVKKFSMIPAYSPQLLRHDRGVLRQRYRRRTKMPEQLRTARLWWLWRRCSEDSDRLLRSLGT